MLFFYNRRYFIFIEIFHICVSLYYLWLNYWYAIVIYGIIISTSIPPSAYCLVGIQLLTVWGQVIQQTYFIASSICFLLKVLRPEKLMFIIAYIVQIRKYLFPLAVFPMSWIVSINFWMLYYLDYTLFEGNIGFVEKLPSWMNHALHTNIIALSIIENVINPRIFYPNLKIGMLCSCVPLLSYCAICQILNTYTNAFVYPLFTRFSNTEKFLYASINIVLNILAHTIGHYIHRLIWGSKNKTL